MSLNDAANVTVDSPSITRISGLRQHNEAKNTGKELIFSNSFIFIITNILSISQAE